MCGAKGWSGIQKGGLCQVSVKLLKPYRGVVGESASRRAALQSAIPRNARKPRDSTHRAGISAGSGMIMFPASQVPQTLYSGDRGPLFDSCAPVSLGQPLLDYHELLGTWDDDSRSSIYSHAKAPHPRPKTVPLLRGSSLAFSIWGLRTPRCQEC